MSFSLIPQYAFRELTDISLDFFRQLGVVFLMLDLDNTIAAYDELAPSCEIIRWTEEIKLGGIKPFIVSNSRRKGRVETFAEKLKLDFIKNACKPSPRAILQAMSSEGLSAGGAALVGDQIFTDTLAANRAGIVSILVRPRKYTNLALTLRFALETPFRAACKNKMYD